MCRRYRMRAQGNLAGVEFINPPLYHHYWEEWREIITESGYFFTKSAMRYFSSRVSWDTLTPTAEGYGFVTSEQPPEYGGSQEPRRYTVREWDRHNGVLSSSDFQEFDTLKEAKKFLETLRVFPTLNHLGKVA